MKKLLISTLLASQLATANTVTLDWEPVYTDVLYRQLIDGELFGYRVYWGLESGNYTESIVTKSTTHQISGLKDSTIYYFAVAAVSALPYWRRWQKPPFCVT